MIFLILGALALGIVVGMFFPFNADLISRILLLALLFLVGIDVGSNKKTLQTFRSYGWSILLIPFLTILGSLLGGVVVSLLTKHSLVEGVAVAAGMAYYTLSSIILTQAAGSELGVIAFLSNISREVLTIVLTPALVRLSKLAPVASGGATSMDTTLPVILKYTSKEIGLLSIVSGVVITLLVPVLVSFFAQFL
ncbi:MAG: lysine exporter LysO family protein [Candidatus Woesearchaeota archaeon]|nr:lysine exporter LysO family protein [Candidatus Woesearchaeota archaeon]